ncbi:hypothetical protein [Methylibium petroleiphilum]|uniref:hypothetical protein n=1 Tax=Methylibium petroleiphilum TaxID=105560 RepID=UPI003D29B00F
MNLARRQTMLAAFGSAALLTTGCMSATNRRPNADGTYCFATGKTYRRRLTCTLDPIPSPTVEADALRFEPVEDALTVYVIRDAFRDATYQVRVESDERAPMVTTPRSFLRMRLQPGVHTLTAAWPEGRSTLEIAGSAGDLLFVELIGTVRANGSSFRLLPADPIDGRRRVPQLRLVADGG